MKKLSIFLMFIAGLALISCTEEEVGPTLNIADATAPQITAPAAGTAIELNEENAAEVIEFTWTAADYGMSLAITYNLEMDLAGNDFAAPITIASVSELTTSMTKGDLNAKLLSNNVAAGATASVEFRVISKISNDVDNLASAIVATEVTTYLVVIDYPKLNVPGNYQGWDPANETTVIYSLRSDEKYEGYVYFQEPTTFKFARGSWDENWGDTGADGTLDPGGDDISADEAGYYKLNVDLNSLTYSFMNTSWGLIGDATPGGWDADTDMTYDTENRVWTLTTDLGAGEIKFRANDAWDLNYGETDPPTGFLSEGGPNIPIAEAGNYTITLILSQANYTYEVVKN